MLDGWKTFIGLAIAAAGAFSKNLGLDVGELTGVSDAVIMLVGFAVAVWGRLVAKGPVV